MTSYALVAVEDGFDHHSALTTLCAKLVLEDVKIVTTTSFGHEILAQGQVTHQHYFHTVPSAVIDKTAVVVCGGLGGREPNKEICSLLRASALEHERVVSVCDSVHYPLLYRGPKSIGEETRKALSAHALRLLSNIDHLQSCRLSGTIPDKLPSKQKVLVVGNGGREHALALKLLSSSYVDHVYCLPGNGGTAKNPGMTNISDFAETEVQEVVNFAKQHSISLVCIGPEKPLVDGLGDALRNAGIDCFGPSKLAARLEGSKAFSKDFMIRHGIPTARYHTFTDYALAEAHLREVDYPIVIKASGLAAGKGVVLPETLEESIAELKSMMLDHQFGDAGSEVVIEERLVGGEVSVFAFCDGHSVVLIPGAQDHKRAFDGDKGPNTGGMGAYAPAPILVPALKARIALEVMQKAVDGAKRDGFPFVGVLFAGMMVTATGFYCLEFNCRFGSPETQVLLNLLESDLYLIMKDCTKGLVLTSEVKWSEDHCATVVLASKGYPGAYEKGVGIELASNKLEDIQVYQGGTKLGSGDDLVTSGGRVLDVTAKRPTLPKALEDIYAAIQSKLVSFGGAQYRKDIGKKASRSPIKLGVLGSTRGTDLQYLLDAIHGGWLRANIEVVVSNKKSAYILTRAAKHHLKTVAHSVKGTNSRAEFDAKVTRTLKEHDVDLVLLIGYMRILSDEFVDEWAGKVINVHPSLLPDFAGGMDLNVHQEVLNAKRKVTGCTIHLVTKEVDGGPIIVQKRCKVLESDTSDTLKARVQALEGPAFVEAINKFVQQNQTF